MYWLVQISVFTLKIAANSPRAPDKVIAVMPEAKALRVAGAGHSVSREHADYFNQTVLAFLGVDIDSPQLFQWLNASSTLASTLQLMPCNLLICNRFYLLKLLIILWSQVQVLVGPPNWKPLISLFTKLGFSSVSGIECMQCIVLRCLCNWLPSRYLNNSS